MENVTMNFDINIIVNAIWAATWAWNLKTGEMNINGHWAEMLGYTQDELYPIDISTWISITISPKTWRKICLMP